MLAALLLSVLFPGAGQAFNGQLRKGVAFAAVYVLAPVPILFLSGPAQSWELWTFGAVKAITHLVSIVDAGGRAYETEQGRRVSTGGGWAPALFLILGGYTLRIGVALALNALVARLPFVRVL